MICATMSQCPISGHVHLTQRRNAMHCQTSPTRRSRWLLTPLAMLALCGQLHAQNATGEPAVTAADNAVLTMVGPNEDSLLTATTGTIADPNTLPSPFNPAWAWQEGGRRRWRLHRHSRGHRRHIHTPAGPCRQVSARLRQLQGWGRQPGEPLLDLRRRRRQCQ